MITEFLYNLIIYPLEAIIEVFYLLFDRVARSPGIAVVGVSLAVNILALPLYAKAEKWQRIERETQARLKAKVDDIKAVFRGDERMMILSTYYRQNGYHPVYALRSSFGLLLQIPFFIAAYAFLVKQPDLAGRSFFFIRDLAAPDALIQLGSMRINALPILMTLINVAAAAVYVKGFALREKVQLYGMAGLFLVLLYSSPAALTLYWTLNNVFSLAKNIVFKAKKPLRAFYLIMAALAAAVLVYTFFFYDTTNRKRMVVGALCALILVSPLVVKAVGVFLDRRLVPALADRGRRAGLFFLSAASLAVLVGLAIPTGLISSSTQEFSFVGGRESPFGFIWIAFSKASGLFLFWPAVIFLLFGARAKSLVAAFMAMLVPAALVNAFVFTGSYGTISRQFAFPDPEAIMASASLAAANIGAIVLCLAVVALVLAIKKAGLVRAAMAVCLLSLTGMTVYRGAVIAGDYAEYRAIRAAELEAGGKEAVGGADRHITPVFSLSRSGKNVIVLMLDRAIGVFVHDIMKESPGLAEKFRGFVWYPNTVSFGAHTLTGVPAVFGGYEYTPQRFNERSGESLVSKHNEALALMPRLFAEAGWDTAVSDASWANYSWVPDNSIFAKYKGIRAFNLEGRYAQKWLSEHGMESDPSKKIERNLLWFGLFRISPMAIRYGLYDWGKWWDSRYEPDEIATLAESYSVLDYLPELVEYRDEGNSFALITNNTTHEGAPLTYPGFSVSKNPSDEKTPLIADSTTWGIFKVNAAALNLVGDFLDSLRANGAYDNTRIIIVSDHGYELVYPEAGSAGRLESRLYYFIPLLMVKDFGATSPLKADTSFHTNADTPALATGAVLGPPGQVKNPFSGQPLKTLGPGESVQIVGAAIYDPSTQNRNTMKFTEADLLEVGGDIFDAASWRSAR
jgi:YidC/Oxa1 family membrane protein insertase